MTDQHHHQTRNDQPKRSAVVIYDWKKFKKFKKTVANINTHF